MSDESVIIYTNMCNGDSMHNKYTRIMFSTSGTSKNVLYIRGHEEIA